MLMNSRRRQMLKLLPAAMTGVSSILGGCDDNEIDLTGESSQPAATNLGNRTFGIVATNMDNGDFGTDVIQRIVDAGAHSTSLSVYWDDIEKSPGVFNPDPDYLAIAELFYPPYGISITHTFSVIDTTNKRLPADLTGRAFDDVQVVARFKDMLDWAVTRMPNVSVHLLSIGNEVDIYLSAHPEEWPSWLNFFAQVSAHARTLWPAAIIGCKATHQGMQQQLTKDSMDSVNSHADGIFLTYYPIQTDFSVVGQVQISTDIDEMASWANSKPVYILEHGSPTDSRLGASNSHQAEFIRTTFTAWDRHADTIPHIEFFALHDFDPAVVAQLQEYYGIDDPLFGAYLGSLGLRTYTGQDKSAWPVLMNEVLQRS